MEPNVDQFILIADLQDFGYKNFSLDMWRTAIEVANVSSSFANLPFQYMFSMRVFRILVMNSSSVFSFIYGTIK